MDIECKEIHNKTVYLRDYVTVFSSDFFVDSYLQFPDKIVWISILSERHTAVLSVDLRSTRGGSARYQHSRAYRERN